MRVIRLVSIFLFSVANFISISEFLQGSNSKGLINARPHWIKILSKRKSPPTIETFQGITTVEGSMTPIEENLNVPSFLNVGRQNTKCLCTDPSPDAGTVGRSCSTTCTTSETYCGRTCVRSTTYAAMFSLFSGVQKQWDSDDVSLSVVITSTYFKVTGKDCKKLESECIASSALVEASRLTGAAVALSAGIAVGAIAIGLAATTPKQEHFNDNNEEENVKHDIIKRSPLFELKSSIEEQQLEVPLFLKVKRQNTECTCKVSVPLWGQQECSVTCHSPEWICDRLCIQTSIFQAVVHLVSSTNVVTTRTFLTIDKNDCDKLEVDCFGSSAIVAAAKSGAVSAIMTGALSAAIAAGAAAFALIPTPLKTREYHNETEEYHQITQRIFRNKIYSRKRRRLLKYRPMGFFESLISKLKSWLIVLLGSSTFNSKSKLNEEDEFKNYDGMPTVIESSISIEDRQQHFLNFKREISSSFCSCADPNPSLTLESAYYGRICSTTCTTTKTLCNGHICMGTTTFTALFTLFLGYQTSDETFNFISGTVTKKFQQIDDKSCAILERNCIMSSALEKARKSGAIAARSAIALSAGIGIGSIALAYLAVAKKSKKEIKKLNQNETEEFDYKKRIERQVKSTNYYDIKENQTHETINQPDIESSINLKVSSFGFQQRQDAGYTCVTDAGNCTTTCLSSKIICGGYCTLTSILENCNQLSTVQPLYPPISTSSPPANNETRDTAPSFSFNSTTFDVINENDCERLEANCIASSAIVSAGRSAEIATGISAVLSAGMVVIAAVISLNNNNNNQQSNDNQQTVNINQIPVNNLPIPVIGLDFPRDGCDDSSVRFADGKCHPVLSRGPCNETNRWVTIDPISLQV